MIDLHTHSIFSDGELIPSELVRRAQVTGYRAIAITDHADHSNIDIIIPA
ncbi:MAG: PHP domain-containing protein, partial [Syntrophaceae bacterium]|nr:PHP domain-containing protein [Syntrophaceae bacterium]